MLGAALWQLTAWANYYVIIGSSAGALTGLTFVVITLIAGRQTRQPGDGNGIAAFTSPTVVHFCAALAVATILSAPWHLLWHAGLALEVAGLGGLGYAVVVLRRLRRMQGLNLYKPVFEDWLWHAILPIGSYAALVVTALVMPSDPEASLFVTGAGTLLLLFIGIHNAWDTVTYLVTDLMQPNDENPK
jgi:hypothetical protein